MAVKFQYINALICERALQEADGVTSAIRIVDIFHVPESSPESAVIQLFVIASLKASPVPVEPFTIGVALIKTSGERVELPPPPGFEQPFALPQFKDDPSIPNGISLVLQIGVKPTNMGTCFIEIDVDGEAVTRVPFTLRRPPAEKTAQ
jgi:hypothetical protein